MSVYIQSELQIQRINHLKNRLKNWKSIDSQIWVTRPDSNKWSSIEVVKHIVIAQLAYESKLNEALSKGIKNSEANPVKARAIASWLIKRFPPKENGDIRYKMKTGKVFKPVLEVEKMSSDDVEEIITDLDVALEQLEGWITENRGKETQNIRFNSAIGPIVKFNVDEACEFMLCHTERHFQQIENTIKSVEK